MSSAQRTSSRSFIRSTSAACCISRNTRLLAGVLCALLGGCSALQPVPELSAADREGLPARFELTDTPFFPQRRYQCGPAALATVLNAQGVQVTPEALVGQVYIPARHGSLPEEMSAAARRHGMLAYPLRAHLADLLRELAAGHPVLVFQNLGLDWLPRWHFAVVIGYDLEAGILVLRSGTTRRWQTGIATFTRTWSRAEYWARVLIKPGALPASAGLLPYLQSARELEQTAGSATALPAFQAATSRWPDRHLAWLALGNSAYALQQFDPAEQAFRQATLVEPQAAEAWNNLAYSLLETGCPRQAVQAVQCAQLLDPAAAYRDSAIDIDARAQGPDIAQCMPVACPVTLP